MVRHYCLRRDGEKACLGRHGNTDPIMDVRFRILAWVLLFFILRRLYEQNQSVKVSVKKMIRSLADRLLRHYNCTPIN